MGLRPIMAGPTTGEHMATRGRIGDDRVEKLEEELVLLRWSVLRLANEECYRVLVAYLDCETRSDYRAWREWAVNRIAELSDRRPSHDMGGLRDGTLRAYCTLCRGGASGQYTSGYAFPIGLTRHLAGSHGNHQCTIFGVADKMALLAVRELELPQDRRRPRLRVSQPKSKPWNEKPAAAPATNAPPLDTSHVAQILPWTGRIGGSPES